jgi:hypothetical protein
VLLLACYREQARIIRNYVGSYFQSIPELKAMVTGETKAGLELSNGAERSSSRRTIFAPFVGGPSYAPFWTKPPSTPMRTRPRRT